jgi:hypothetical protein
LILENRRERVRKGENGEMKGEREKEIDDGEFFFKKKKIILIEK